MRTTFIAIEEAGVTLLEVWTRATQTLNLGILAHVDAGKTTLTERLLYAAGVIDAVGSVDKGRPYRLARARAAARDHDQVGRRLVRDRRRDGEPDRHARPPDFIAEVERVLSVLDGCVLVISAVEGVQPQTRISMRALQRLEVPTLLFVNKIDRAGKRTLSACSTRSSSA